MSETKMPILNGVCQGDFDFAGYRALNLNLDDLASGAPFIDNTALIRSSDEETALGHFKLNFTTPGVHRVYTLPNYNATMATLAGVEAFTNKTSYNGVTLSGTGGMLIDAVVSLTGGLLTEGDVSILSAGELILRAPALCDVTFPVSGTLATTAQLPVISDIAYNATSWNGNLDGASKNAIRDKIESMSGSLSTPFDDDKDLLKNVSDPTKLLRFSLAGLTTATTRTLSAPDKNGTIALLDDIPDFHGMLFDADQPGRTLYLAGNAAFFGDFTVEGGFITTLHVSAITDVTLPQQGTLATLDGEETLTNKGIEGGTVESITKLSLRSSGSAHDLTIEPNAVMTSSRKLLLALGDADRTLTLANNLATSGNFGITLTAEATTNVVLPASGRLVPSVSVPANDSDSGTAGDEAWDSTYFYKCYAPNQWGRITMETTW